MSMEEWSFTTFSQYYPKINSKRECFNCIHEDVCKFKSYVCKSKSLLTQSSLSKEKEILENICKTHYTPKRCELCQHQFQFEEARLWKKLKGHTLCLNCYNFCLQIKKAKAIDYIPIEDEFKIFYSLQQEYYLYIRFHHRKNPKQDCYIFSKRIISLLKELKVLPPRSPERRANEKFNKRIKKQKKN